MQAIKTRYFGPTNSRGSRITAKSSGGSQHTVGYNGSLSTERNHDHAAWMLCQKEGWTDHDLVRGCIGPDEYCYTFDVSINRVRRCDVLDPEEINGPLSPKAYKRPKPSKNDTPPPRGWRPQPHPGYACAHVGGCDIFHTTEFICTKCHGAFCSEHVVYTPEHLVICINCHDEAALLTSQS
jgi:hypothetical protein